MLGIFGNIEAPLENAYFAGEKGSGLFHPRCRHALTIYIPNGDVEFS